jgi:hypothetical protein
MRLLRIDRCKELFHRLPRWRAKCIIEVDRCRDLLKDKFIPLGEYAVLGKRLLHALSVGTA